MTPSEVITVTVPVDELVHLVEYDIKNMIDVLRRYTESNEPIPITDAWRLEHLANSAHTYYRHYAQSKGELS